MEGYLHKTWQFQLVPFLPFDQLHLRCVHCPRHLPHLRGRYFSSLVFRQDNVMDTGWQDQAWWFASSNRNNSKICVGPAPSTLCQKKLKTMCFHFWSQRQQLLLLHLHPFPHNDRPFTQTTPLSPKRQALEYWWEKEMELFLSIDENKNWRSWVLKKMMNSSRLLMKERKILAYHSPLFIFICKARQHCS